MVNFEQNVVSTRSATPPLLQFGIDRTRYHVARGKVLRLGRVALHESFALAVDEITAFTANPFRYQHANAGEPSWVKLHKLHVLQGDSGTQRHRHAVAGVDVGIRGSAVYATGPTGGDERGSRLDQQRFASLDFECQRTQAVPLLVQNQVEHEEFIKEMGLGP